MHIGFFTSIEGWGGSESYLRDLILGVSARGHRATLFGVGGSRLFAELKQSMVTCVAWKEAPQQATVHPSETTSEEIPIRQTATHQSIRTAFRVLLPPSFRLLIGNYRELRLLMRLFMHHPVDVMHVSNSGYEVAGLACKQIGIRTIVMNMVTPPSDSLSIRRMLQIYSTRRYNHVSSQSAYCTNEWQRLSGVPSSRCSFVWNGADLTRFVPRRETTNESDPFRIVSLGRLHPMKGYRYLIEAMTQLPTCHLEILGEGSEREYLEKQIVSLGLQDRVFLPGLSDTPEKVLQSADCFALPSISHESCPAVLSQAMACGLPLVTSDFGPLVEINEAGVTGLVVPMQSVDPLARAIQTLMNNPALRSQMGAMGLQKSQQLDINMMVSKTLRLYEECVVT